MQHYTPVPVGSRPPHLFDPIVFTAIVQPLEAAYALIRGLDDYNAAIARDVIRYASSYILNDLPTPQSHRDSLPSPAAIWALFERSSLSTTASVIQGKGTDISRLESANAPNNRSKKRQGETTEELGLRSNNKRRKSRPQDCTSMEEDTQSPVGHKSNPNPEPCDTATAQALPHPSPCKAISPTQSHTINTSDPPDESRQPEPEQTGPRGNLSPEQTDLPPDTPRPIESPSPISPHVPKHSVDPQSHLPERIHPIEQRSRTTDKIPLPSTPASDAGSTTPDPTLPAYKSALTARRIHTRRAKSAASSQPASGHKKPQEKKPKSQRPLLRHPNLNTPSQDSPPPNPSRSPTRDANSSLRPPKLARNTSPTRTSKVSIGRNDSISSDKSNPESHRPALVQEEERPSGYRTGSTKPDNSNAVATQETHRKLVDVDFAIGLPSVKREVINWRDNFYGLLSNAQSKATPSTTTPTQFISSEEAIAITNFFVVDVFGVKALDRLKDLVIQYEDRSESEVTYSSIAKAELLRKDSSLPPSLRLFFTQYANTQSMAFTSSTALSNFHKIVSNLALNRRYTELMDQTRSNNDEFRTLLTKKGYQLRRGLSYRTCATQYLADALGLQTSVIQRQREYYRPLALIVETLGEGVIPLLPPSSPSKTYHWGIGKLKEVMEALSSHSPHLAPVTDILYHHVCKPIKLGRPTTLNPRLIMLNAPIDRAITPSRTTTATCDKEEISNTVI